LEVNFLFLASIKNHKYFLTLGGFQVRYRYQNQTPRRVSRCKKSG
jgi:hypothetical protein